MGICWRVLLRPCLLAKSFYSRQFAACDMIPSIPQYASSLWLRKHLDASKSKVKGMLGVPGMLRGWWSSNKKPTCEDSGGSDGSVPPLARCRKATGSELHCNRSVPRHFFFRLLWGIWKVMMPSKTEPEPEKAGFDQQKDTCKKIQSPSRTGIFQAFRCWMSECWSILLSIELIPFWKVLL